ncbi:DUF3667 domain-containing protein [Pseudobacter ginsenosidimutans]|uniref:Uncharacterized protein DUF3667 n=1 Tax=Pseudobacter ginsenosidimutans TaxID=661488 RepID=A0A4Q7N2G1_9BACT|nr:DUF3667 domain-containing protein [Pseudobacter ginsenosidimutans]QEC43611.1 DUF3667 domain-containing protein [Pseudobacter ginsenosidimutans]RZS75009.1 uncharacterized protein DUF3667 [Pseudobacter ginsenosidimutans]
MSHGKERHEKICLNCKSELIGRFCQNCGQENIEPHETVWSLVSHFFADITHFDGKFFSTVRYLITRPGFLSKEYIAGRRASYLHPIRMYVFTSALFFLIFFSTFQIKRDDFDGKVTAVMQGTNNLDLDKAETKMLKKANTATDSADVKAAYDAIRKMRDQVLLNPKKQGLKFKPEGEGFNFVDSVYRSKKDYDSVQASLPESERDGFVMRKLQYRRIEVQEKYQGDNKAYTVDVMNKFLHMFPYLLFVSLPLYALFLKLLYARRKQFLYVDHALFLIHLYIFTFLFLLVQIALFKLWEEYEWIWLGWLIFLQYLAGIYYTYKAMRKFYEQGRGKTFVKFMLLNFLCGISLVLLFVAFLFLSLFRT